MLFFVLYKLIPSFESVDKNVKSDHSNERYGAVLSDAVFVFFFCKLKLRSFFCSFENKGSYNVFGMSHLKCSKDVFSQAKLIIDKNQCFPFFPINML